MEEIYLDNAATTPCDPKALKAMGPFWSEIYGNSSSFNDAGRKAKKALNQARGKIARLLGAKNQEIIFTSSATEANNLAIFGTANGLKNKSWSTQNNLSARPSSQSVESSGYKIITTTVEHHSVLEPIKKLEKDGIKIHYLPVSKEGLINLNEFKKTLTPDTALVSIIYTNNEIGSIQPIKKIAKILKDFKKDSAFPYFHTDAAQAAGHLDINVNNLGVDLMTISSHKIYGPKGIAALYIRRGTRIEPLFYGGGQEFGVRSATEPVPLIVGFSRALELAEKKQKENIKKGEFLRNYFIGKLKEIIPEVKINGPENEQNRVPHIISATFPKIENEQLLLYLDKYGIRASAGAACASSDIEPSHVLLAIGLKKNEARSTIRFSLGRQITKDNLDYVLKILPKVINKIKSLYPDNLKKYYYIKP